MASSAKSAVAAFPEILTPKVVLHTTGLPSEKYTGNWLLPTVIDFPVSSVNPWEILTFKIFPHSTGCPRLLIYIGFDSSPTLPFA